MKFLEWNVTWKKLNTPSTVVDVCVFLFISVLKEAQLHCFFPVNSPRFPPLPSFVEKSDNILRYLAILYDNELQVFAQCETKKIYVFERNAVNWRRNKTVLLSKKPLIPYAAWLCSEIPWKFPTHFAHCELLSSTKNETHKQQHCWNEILNNFHVPEKKRNPFN